MSLVPVSTVVLTHNESANLGRCLGSVAGWCEEIHVVDSGSTDDTVAIARRYTQWVHHHPYVDHASQFGWVWDNLPLACDWVLILDADNVVSEELKRQIADELARPDQPCAAFYSVHTHMFRGQRIHGLKGAWLRLMRRSRSRIDASELVDFRVLVEGPIGHLSGEIVEHNLKENDIDFWIDKHQKFSSRAAIEEVLRRGGYVNWSFRPRFSGTADERMMWLRSKWYGMPLFIRPFLYFLFRYFCQLGFLDGRTGLVYHVLQAFWYRLVVDVKMQDIYSKLAAGELTLEELAARHARGSRAPAPAHDSAGVSLGATAR